MDQQETEDFVKSVEATPFSYHAGFSRFLDSIQVWSYLARKSSMLQFANTLTYFDEWNWRESTLITESWVNQFVIELSLFNNSYSARFNDQNSTDFSCFYIIKDDIVVFNTAVQYWKRAQLL